MNEMFWKHEYLTLKEVEIPKLIVEFLQDIREIHKEIYDESDFKTSKILFKLIKKWEAKE